MLPRFRLKVPKTPVNGTERSQQQTFESTFAHTSVTGSVAGSINRKKSTRTCTKRDPGENVIPNVPQDHLGVFSAPVYTSSSSVLGESTSYNIPHPSIAPISNIPVFRVNENGLNSYYKYPSLSVPDYSTLLQSPLHLTSPLSTDTASSTLLDTDLGTTRDSRMWSYSDLDHDIDMTSITDTMDLPPTPATLVEQSPDSDMELVDNEPVDLGASKGRKHAPALDKVSRMLSALKSLSAANITPLDLMIAIHTSENTSLAKFRKGFYSKQGPEKFNKLLTFIWNEEEGKGKEVMSEWLSHYGVEYVCEKVSREVEAAKKPLQMSTKEVNTDYIENGHR
ncbi:hypothetical protein BJ165DRAFT_1534106 [Panaeolus papilionaceus]|nr:hypothetical protein BJ165DRAFT_1534106 [Panaeolus papilionaceus]